MLIPFKKEIEHAFRKGRNLPAKLLAAVVVGLSIGLHSLLVDGASVAFSVCALAACVLVCVVGVLALSVKDAVHRRIVAGERVGVLVRLYLASGKLSVALWLATAIVAALLACILWPV